MLILVNKKGLKPITQPSTHTEIREKEEQNNPKASRNEIVRAESIDTRHRKIGKKKSMNIRAHLKKKKQLY